MLSVPNKQQGVILIVALIMLLVMTTLGVTTMTDATLQERMASNSRQQQIARTNAEAALREAENFLNESISGSVSSDTSFDDLFYDGNNYKAGFYSAIAWEAGTEANPLSFTLTDDGNWLGANAASSIALGRDLEGNRISGDRPSRYVIEYLGCMGNCGNLVDKYFGFRIVAIGWGRDTNISSVLQGIYLTEHPTD